MGSDNTLLSRWASGARVSTGSTGTIFTSDSSGARGSSDALRCFKGQ